MKKQNFKFYCMMAGIFFTAWGCNRPNSKLDYPQARQDAVVDDYYGTMVPDPYRWMENDTTAEVAAWVEAENAVTQKHLAQIPFRNTLKKRFAELMTYERESAPGKKHGKYYYSHHDGVQNQSVLYVKDSLTALGEVLLDPNTLSEDGTVALASTAISKDGKYMAYSISRSGSDWQEIYVMDLNTRQLTQDHIMWCKFSAAQWSGNGFYYSAYDAPEEGKEFSNINEFHKIYYHTLGTPQSEDVLVYENRNFPKRFYSCSVSEDDRCLFVYESGANRGNRLFFKDLTNPDDDFRLIADNDAFSYSFFEAVGDTLYFITNEDAPMYKIVSTTIQQPEKIYWKDLINENKFVMNDCEMINGHIFVTYLQDASDHAYVYDLDGNRLHEVTLPTLGSVSFSGSMNDEEIFYTFSSYTYPATVYAYDLASNTSTLYSAPKVAFTPDDFEVKQVFFPSKDNTMIPMFLIHKKGLVLNGANPVMLYGYGGFNISMTPSFATTRLPFVEQGGVFAIVNLRGGGEYGDEWHVAGTKMQKQNVFDDFIAAAEFLIQEQYTSVGHIGIMGGSNGGLLVGAVVNQRPELYTVALPAVGVMDMLRYHKFTIGWNWASDYGTSEDNEEMFRYLLAYSPIHTVRNDGTKYPAIMVTTADHDDRVVPAHSFKYAATLQAANTGNAPKLIRIETKAGHGAGKPLSKQIEEWADMYAFAMYHLGMQWK